MRPTQDWMTLEPIRGETALALPDSELEKVSEAQSFRVTALGPWEEWPVGDGTEWVQHDIKVGDIVIIVGMPAVFEYERTKHVCARARDVAFVIPLQEGEMGEVTSE